MLARIPDVISVMKTLPAVAVLVALLPLAVMAETETGGDAKQPVMLVSPGSLEELAGEALSDPGQGETTVPVSRMLLAMARLVAPEDATLDQAIAAIVRLNPEVFVDGDLERATIPDSIKKPGPEQVRAETPESLDELLASLQGGSGDQAGAVSPESEEAPADAPGGEAAPAGQAVVQETADNSGSESSPTVEVQAPGQDGGGYLWILLPAAALLLLLLFWLMRQSKSMDRKDHDRRSLNREVLSGERESSAADGETSRAVTPGSTGEREQPADEEPSGAPVEARTGVAAAGSTAGRSMEADGESAGIERAREKIREAREKALGKEASKQNRKSAEEAGGDEAAAAEEAEQKKRLEEEKARKEAEEKARLEVEAKRKAEEQKKKAELERKKRQEEKRKAEQEKRKAEERKKAEAERRKAQEARKKAEEERARKQEEKRKKKQREKERTEWLESLAKDLLMAPENAIDQGNRSPASKQEHDWKSSLPADYQALLGDSPGAEKPAPGADEAVDRVNAASASLRIARNYVDMGEAELAGRLLHDVLQTGNSSQQAAAKALLEKIKQ